MTCQHFTHGVDQHCHTLLGCTLRQKQLQQGQHLKKRCKPWAPTWQKEMGWAPEAGYLARCGGESRSNGFMGDSTADESLWRDTNGGSVQSFKGRARPSLVNQDGWLNEQRSRGRLKTSGGDFCCHGITLTPEDVSGHRLRGGANRTVFTLHLRP